MSRHRRGPYLLVVFTVVALLAGACAASATTTKKHAGKKTTAKRRTTKKKAVASTTTPEKPKPVTVKLGYFPNITHAPAIVGVEGGLFQDALGANTLKTYSFNAGPEASEALLSGAIDAAFIGPNPSVNAYAKSKAVKIIAGATSGGA